MNFPVFLWLLVGLIMLVIGAEGLVRGASKLATLAGISPLVIGLTVVSYGTSAPELAVSLRAAFLGQADITLGNIIGSNIFNVLMILGLAALIVPLTVAQQLIRLDVPIMIGVSALTFVFAADGELGRIEGGLLVLGSIAYTVFQVWQSRRESNAEVQAEYAQEYGNSEPQTWKSGVKHVVVLLAGLATLVMGANLLVDAATKIAESLGISQLIIGLTIVAIGTSLPELATTVVASYRGERDIAVGNVVGSNIFNILAILGSSALVNKVTVSPAAIQFDIPVMVAVAIACLPIFYTGSRISRWEGILFIAYYVAYTTYLGLNAMGHEQLGLFSNMMLLFVIPLTVVTLLTVLLQRPEPRTSLKSPLSEPESLSRPSPDSYD